MKRILSLIILLSLLAVCAKHSCAQNNMRVSLTYDDNGNRTYLTAYLIRVDENAMFNDSLGDAFSERYTDIGLDTINGINISIYPNPTCGSLVVSADSHDDSSPMNMSLLSFGGKLLDEHTSTMGNTEFDLTDYTAGVYFLVINYNGEKHVWKIIKKN